MKRYHVTLETVTPLMIGEGRTTQQRQSLQYLPGGTFLGGLAYAYLRGKHLAPEDKDASFDRLFLNEQIHFGNLYPANFTPPILDDYPVKPLPRTAHSCKRWEGFTYQTGVAGSECHGVADHLIFWSLFVESGQQKLKILNENQYCGYDGCQERLDHFTGFYRMQNLQVCGSATVHTRLMTGTGINRFTGTVQEEILYNFEVISEVTPDDTPQIFQGIMRLDADVDEEFRQLVGSIQSESAHFRIGRGKTRGLGRLRFASCKETPPIPHEQFVERLRKFDAKVKEQAGKYEVDVGNWFYFAITCCGDVILREGDLRYATRITDAYLRQLFGMSDIHAVYHNAAVARVRGWNALWRLPKTVEPAIAKGSVFMFKSKGMPHDDDEFFQKLYLLEQDGIGSRKAEGFGWISISDDLHQEVNQI